MSVYTPVTAEELEAWLTRYAVGGLVSQSPIATGIENTNYFVTTTKGRYVLTLYERLPRRGAAVLSQPDGASRATPASNVPAPIRDRTGTLFGTLNGKPASLVTRVDGAPIDAPDVAALRGRRRRRSDVCTSRRRRIARVSPIAADRRGGGRPRAPCARSSLPEQNELLVAELKFLTGFAKVRLPRGAIHGDLFCDNVLFVGERVSGIIDFGFAATDALAYDLAITVNDWCVAKRRQRRARARARRGARRRLRRRAATHGGRACAMAGAAARRRAALLAVQALRSPPAASR